MSVITIRIGQFKIDNECGPHTAIALIERDRSEILRSPKSFEVIVNDRDLSKAIIELLHLRSMNYLCDDSLLSVLMKLFKC